MPIVTIIRPSWLDVEKAIIFLISFWVRAHIAVNRVVIAPKHNKIDCMNLLFSVSGLLLKSEDTTFTIHCLHHCTQPL